MPSRYADCSFANFEPGTGTRHAYSLARRWSEDYRHGRSVRRGLLFHGPPGSGKTHLAVAILREAIFSRASARSLFLNVPDWLNALRESWNSDDRGAEPPNPQGYELLVIDDLGAENATSWTRERLYSLINHREQNGLATLVTTNLDPAEIGRRLGRPTSSRLTKLCADVPLDPAADFRSLRQEEPGSPR